MEEIDSRMAASNSFYSKNAIPRFVKKSFFLLWFFCFNKDLSDNRVTPNLGVIPKHNSKLFSLGKQKLLRGKHRSVCEDLGIIRNNAELMELYIEIYMDTKIKNPACRCRMTTKVTTIMMVE